MNTAVSYFLSADQNYLKLCLQDPVRVSLSAGEQTAVLDGSDRPFALFRLGPWLIQRHREALYLSLLSAPAGRKPALSLRFSPPGSLSSPELIFRGGGGDQVRRLNSPVSLSLSPQADGTVTLRIEERADAHAGQATGDAASSSQGDGARTLDEAFRSLQEKELLLSGVLEDLADLKEETREALAAERVRLSMDEDTLTLLRGDPLLKAGSVRDQLAHLQREADALEARMGTIIRLREKISASVHNAIVIGNGKISSREEAGKDH